MKQYTSRLWTALLALVLFISSFMLGGCDADPSAPPGMEEPIVVQTAATETPESEDEDGAGEEDEEADETATPEPTDDEDEEVDETATPEATDDEDEEADETATPEATDDEEKEADEGPTASTLADSGAEVYSAECAQCHGEQGQGVSAPAVIGDAANLAKYNTGQGLYDYVSSAMPLDEPGSLSDQEYLEVVTYLLLENGYVEENDPVSEDQLDEIELD